MFWFKKRKQERKEHIAIERESMIEIIAHQAASKRAVEEVKRANRQLKKALAGNGFTVKIFLAAGGKATSKEAHGRD